MTYGDLSSFGGYTLRYRGSSSLLFLVGKFHLSFIFFFYTFGELMYVLSMYINSLGVTSKSPGSALVQQALVGYPFMGPTAGRICVNLM